MVGMAEFEKTLEGGESKGRRVGALLSVVGNHASLPNASMWLSSGARVMPDHLVL